MGDWTMVQHAVHDDPAYVELDADARLLFLWSFTNPDATLCGLYRASWRQLAGALAPLNGRVPPEMDARVEAALNALEQKPLLLYDEDTEVLWVVNRARHANRSPKVATAMRREYERCPASQLKAQFRTRYGRQLDLPAGRKQR